MRTIFSIVMFPIAFSCWLTCSGLSTDQAKELRETKTYLDSLRTYLSSNKPGDTEFNKSANSISRDDQFRLELRRLATRVDSLSEALTGMVPEQVVKALIRDAIKNSGHGFGKGGATVIPEHEWVGTSLRFKDPDGKWGKLVNLGNPSHTTVDTVIKSSVTQNLQGLGPVLTFTINENSSASMSKELQKNPGLVVATIHAGRNGRGIISGTSKGVRVKASVHWKDFGENENSFITDNSFVMPVGAGTGWSVIPVQWQGVVEATVYWLAFQ